MAGKNKRLAVNLIAQIISFAVSLGVSFVLTPYITAKLGKDVYGFVGMAYQFTSYLSIITVSLNSMLNMFVATSYHKGDIEQAKRYYSSITTIDFAIGVSLCVPLILFALNMNLFLDVPHAYLTDIKILWVMIFMVFPINLMQHCFNTSLFVKNRMDLAALRSIESNIIKAVVLLGAFVFLPTKIWYVGLAALLCAIYVLIISYLYKLKLTPELKVSSSTFSWDAVKSLLAVGIWSTISQLTTIFISGLDLLFSNIFISAMAMGYISYAQTVPTQMSILMNTIKGTFLPNATKVYATGNKEEFLKELFFNSKLCGFLGAIPILGFCVFGTDFYHLWLPTLTDAEVIKINILSIMILLPTMFEVYISPFYCVNSLTKKVKIPVLVSFAVGIANIVLELLLIKTTGLGVYAIEIATGVLLVFKIFCFSPIYAAKNMNVKWYTFYKPLLRGSFSTVVVLIVFAVIRINTSINSWFTLVAVCGMAGAVGYVISYMIIWNKSERSKANQKLMQLFRKK